MKKNILWIILLTISIFGLAMSAFSLISRTSNNYTSEGQYFDPETGTTQSEGAIIFYIILGLCCLLTTSFSIYKLKKTPPH